MAIVNSQCLYRPLVGAAVNAPVGALSGTISNVVGAAIMAHQHDGYDVHSAAVIGAIGGAIVSGAVGAAHGAIKAGLELPFRDVENQAPQLPCQQLGEAAKCVGVAALSGVVGAAVLYGAQQGLMTVDHAATAGAVGAAVLAAAGLVLLGLCYR